MIVGFLLGAAATVGAAMALGSALGGVEQGPVPRGQAASCTIGLVLFAPDSSLGSQAVDATTGGLGFSHVAIQGCEVADDGTPLLVDCRPGSGVHRRPESDRVYRGRPRARLLLTGPAASELYGCARAKVGASFAPRVASGAYLCAQLVYECLPGPLRVAVDAESRYSGPGGIVSPNQIAAAFGLRHGRVVIL